MRIRGHYAAIGEDWQIAEEDVAHHVAANLCDQREPRMAAGAEGIHEHGLIILPKGQAVDLADGLVIGR